MARHTAPAEADARTEQKTSTLSTVVVHGSDISVERAYKELPLAETRSQVGGVDLPALLAGGLAGLGTAALLGGLLGAVASAAVDPEGQALPALVTAALVLAVSGLLAGWTAGRAARYDGGRNGLLAGLLLLLLVGLLAGAVTMGVSAADLELPSPAEGDRLAVTALVTGLVGTALALLAAALAGRAAARWHRSVDDLLLGTRPGAVAPAPVLEVRR
ncbi:MAG: hypothetical protein WD794_13405 [Mycobacteriales bacterium]